MKASAPASSHHQQQDKVNRSLTPEMRQQVRQLKRRLEEYDDWLSDHLELVISISAALDTARVSARCLLKNDPFAAWEKVAKLDDDWDPCFDTSTEDKPITRIAIIKPRENVEKLITQEMRQHALEAKNRLENYVKGLSKFFDDVHNLDSPNAALQLAEDLQRRKPLETTDAGKGVVGARAEDDFGGL